MRPNGQVSYTSATSRINESRALDYDLHSKAHVKNMEKLSAFKTFRFIKLVSLGPICGSIFFAV